MNVIAAVWPTASQHQNTWVLLVPQSIENAEVQVPCELVGVIVVGDEIVVMKRMFSELAVLVQLELFPEVEPQTFLFG